MARKKYYAVKVGVTPGIYDTWGECQEQVKGYGGAEYKSFSTREEAEQFIGTLSSGTNIETDDLNIEELIENLDDTTVIAFVDGSYDAPSKYYGYGVVLIGQGNVTETLIGSDNNKDYVETRNVAGEIEGVQHAITNAVGKGYKKIQIFYDYAGIEEWATDGWRANSQVAKDYVVFIKEMRRCIDIEFYKVKAHSGVKYNELADELAKKSLLQKGIKNHSDSCITVTGVDVDDFESIFEILKIDSEDRIKVLEAGNSNGSKNFILSLNKDKVVVSCYRRGNTTIQGKQSPLLEELMRLVVELLPDKGEVLELLNNYHEVTIEQDNITKQFNHYLPNFSKEKTDDQKLINILNQAVYNTMLQGERPDYTDLASPSLRAIEYYMYEMFISKGIMSREDDKSGFGYFDKIDEVYYLQAAHQGKFEARELEYINELYNFYYNNRHTLNHWNKDGLTRVLETMEEARELIISNLELIDKYYTVF
ncbi:TPA: viroplasmin family protein [Bacillus cereus]